MIWSPETHFERSTQQTNKQKNIRSGVAKEETFLAFLMQQQKQWTAKTRQQNDMTTRRICRGERCAKKIAGLFEQCNAVMFIFPQ